MILFFKHRLVLTILVIALTGTPLTSYTLSKANAAALNEKVKSGSVKKAKKIVKSKKCASGALNRSKCMVDLIFEDLSLTYSAGVGGGGVSEIKAIASNGYLISILQEERIDQFEYEFDTSKKGIISILKRTERTKSF
jgi:hypothetical protein